MKLYQIIHNVWNRKGRLIKQEKYVNGFETEEAMKYWLHGKWSISENNESWVVWKIYTG